MNKLIEKEYDNQTFEEIKHIDENGIEFWYARELMPIYNMRNGKILKRLLIKQ